MTTRARWDAFDRTTAGLLGLVAAILRSVGLGTPKELVFDEFYYVPDACRYAVQIPSLCGPEELTWMQPPLGKWLIAWGMWILGPTRFGWRLASVVAGVVTVVLVYALARRLFRTRAAAVVAAGLLTIDFMHLVHSRLAMLDVFVALFVTAGALCAVIDRDDPAARGMLRPWRLGAGALMGAAVAVKWSGALVLVGLVLLTLLWDRRRAREGRERFGTLAVATFLAFAVASLATYMLTYAGRFDGSLLVAPWSEGSWFSDWFTRQLEMIEYHTATRANLPLLAHPASSPAWSWLLIKRPIAYHFSAKGGLYREILALGHPLLWPLGIPVLGWLCVRLARVRDSLDPAALVLTLFASAYLPWFLLTSGGQDPYSYYLLPAIPFLYLGFGAVAEALWARLGGRLAIAAVAVAGIALLAFYFPLLTGRPVTVSQWRSRILFRSCAEFDNPALQRVRSYIDPDLPLEGLERPPLPGDRLLPTGTKAIGWCWI